VYGDDFIQELEQHIDGAGVLHVAQGYRERFDLHWLPPLGFNNTYAITVRQEHAGRLGLETIGDLAPHADRLSGGFTSEFMERPDGYPGLSKAYDIQLASTRDLDPGLMYQAVDQKQVDVICAFATDGRIAEYNLKTLDDDRHFFPPYDACPVVRGDLLDRHPQVRNALVALAGSIDDEQMRKLNYAVDVQKKTPADVARGWLDWRKGETPEPWRGDDAGQAEGPVNFWTLGWQRRGEVGQKTVEHLYLTVMGVVIAICIGVPLGVLIHRVAPARGPVLAFTEIMQTIPSLAMLAFLFVLYGLLGPAPAITALVLYALLPIVLNTFTGLKGVSPQVVEAANGVGMSGPQRLWMVELPLAAPVLIAGIRNATVLTVGIATLCTFIGAGGLGDFIARGLARSDARLTLLGAVPAAIMAVILSLGIRGLEKLSERT